MVHGGHKLLHEVATHVGGQIGLAVHLALQGFCKEIWGVEGQVLYEPLTPRMGRTQEETMPALFVEPVCPEKDYGLIVHLPCSTLTPKAETNRAARKTAGEGQEMNPGAECRLCMQEVGFPLWP